MLLAINQADSIHNFNRREAEDKVIECNDNVYILDTDDMKVDTILGKELKRIIQNGVVSISNIDKSGDRIYYSCTNYDFNRISYFTCKLPKNMMPNYRKLK